MANMHNYLKLCANLCKLIRKSEGCKSVLRVSQKKPAGLQREMPIKL